MHLGIYRFEGDPQELLPAYDRLMETLPPDGLLFHACVIEENGIAIFDACPTEEAFRGFSTNPKLAEAFSAAGLPQPTIEDGAVHNALVGYTFPTSAA